MKPEGLIEPYRRQIDDTKLARHLFTNCHGRANRTKVRDLGPLFFGPALRIAHGSAHEVALRNALQDLLLKHGLPVGTESGPDGGVWWIATEAERWAVVRQLEEHDHALRDRLSALRGARLEWKEPAGPDQGTLLP